MEEGKTYDITLKTTMRGWKVLRKTRCGYILQKEYPLRYGQKHVRNETYITEKQISLTKEVGDTQ